MLQASRAKERALWGPTEPDGGIKGRRRRIIETPALLYIYMYVYIYRRERERDYIMGV